MIRFKQIFWGILLILSVSQIALAQVADEKEFNKYKWDKFDFTKKKVTKAQLDKLQYQTDDFEPIDELAILRGIVFGNRGRIFKDKELQKYFASQPWYKANPDFKDEMLTEKEYKNLSIIKQAEENAMSKMIRIEG